MDWLSQVRQNVLGGMHRAKLLPNAIGQKISACYERTNYRRPLKRLFHWSYSGVLIPLFVSTGIGLALGGHHVLAYYSFVCAGLWCICYWVTSDILERKRQELIGSRQTRRSEDRLRDGNRRYRVWLWGGSALFAVVTLIFLGLVRLDDIHTQRDDADHNLIIEPHTPPSGELYDTNFTVTNNSHLNVVVHQIWCGGRVLTANKVALLGLRSRVLQSDVLVSPGGDSHSEQCLHAIRDFVAFRSGPVTCADETVEVDYSIEVEPKVIKTKFKRFVTGEGGIWVGQGINDSRNWCPTPQYGYTGPAGPYGRTGLF